VYRSRIPGFIKEHLASKKSYGAIREADASSMHPSPVHGEVALATVVQSIGKQAKVFKIFCIG
jgi:hypothetical protein